MEKRARVVRLLKHAMHNQENHGNRYPWSGFTLKKKEPNEHGDYRVICDDCGNSAGTITRNPKRRGGTGGYFNAWYVSASSGPFDSTREGLVNQLMNRHWKRFHGEGEET